MEKRINKKIETYLTDFKTNVYNKSVELELEQSSIQLMQYIYDYERLTLEKEDFMKRKRVKNVVHLFNRCCAKRASGEQCTRTRKGDSEYCGTHMKGTPHGIVDQSETPQQTNQKVEVWVQDIQGIGYYIDNTGNVYMPEDILSNKVNPKIIAKYVKNGDLYSIPEFGI